MDVADHVKAALAKLQTEIPPTVKVDVLYDRSATIQASVNDVTFTLKLTLVLVVAMIVVNAIVIPAVAWGIAKASPMSDQYVAGLVLAPVQSS